MKKLLVFLCAMFVLSAHATTVNIDWLSDGQTYAQTTCETGGNFTLPSPTPTKYGYHFVGWQQNDAIGSWSQSGTPTPDNPIEPTFRQFGNTVLRAVGSGNNLIADSYDPTTGKITRRVGVKVLDGTENISGGGITISDMLSVQNKTDDLIVTHMKFASPVGPGTCYHLSKGIYFYYPSGISSTEQMKDWLAQQYANGTPVIIVYPLATPVEEVYNAQ